MANNDTRSSISRQPEKRHRSIFDVPSDFFDSCRLLPPRSSASSSSSSFSEPVESYVTASSPAIETLGEDSQDGSSSKNSGLSRWSCNTCKAEFESLQDQRSHFKSDVHRFNVKLSIAGKNIVKEEDFDELSSESLCKDYDVSSISGSEDETDKRSCNDVHRGLVENAKQKLVIHLRTGERVSVWKCLFLDDFEKILYDLDKSVAENERLPYLRESEVIGKLKYLIHEPRDNTKLRVVLLASGGHFAGCVFDGNLVVAHKTFHRYVVRAKSGKKQSSKDGTGKSPNSAGASLRRYNELALKKEIQEIFADWKTYFDVSCCVFIYAPSSNRQLLFNGEKPYFSAAHSAIRNVPFSVRRPTLKEARRIYNQLMQVNYEVDQWEFQPNIKEDSLPDASTLSGRDSATSKVNSADNLQIRETTETSASYDKSDDLTTSREREIEVVCAPTPLHEASKSGDAHRVLELLESGLDPCAKDERGRTPYMLATDKEVRDTFRRFMAINLDKWDWVAAKVPSALTKEMEDSQAAKQAEKDAKRKARAKELKKLRKAREKKAQAEAALTENTGTSLENRVNGLSVASGGEAGISEEEKLRRAQAEEREKRAAAAERRMAAAALSLTATTNSGSNGSQPPKSGMGTHDSCSCCHDSLEGKVPFHRYNYKYCSTTCMHLHREILEAG